MGQCLSLKGMGFKYLFDFPVRNTHKWWGKTNMGKSVLQFLITLFAFLMNVVLPELF
jgi:hypothetical protein